MHTAPNRPSTGAARWETQTATQQPDWRSHPDYERVRNKLSAARPLVSAAEITELHDGLAEVTAGSALVLQLGDCAESFYESTDHHTINKLGALHQLANRLAGHVDRPIIEIGRLGGQYAKPRSQQIEVIDGVSLPVFRGHLVNSEAPHHDARLHDPRRMLWAYHFSDDVQRVMRDHRDQAARLRPVHTGPWSSADALVLDYVGPLLRVDEATGDRFLTTTHFPWIGERTRGIDSAHIQLLRDVRNPIACKLGPDVTPEDVLCLCEELNAERRSGRLTLIVRMGYQQLQTTLPPVVQAVGDAGYPVVWLSDPMHANTVHLASGVKTRYLDHMIAEAREFKQIVEACGQHVGGLHLETAADDVTECIGSNVEDEKSLSENYTSLCDPRLNHEQAKALIDAVFAEG